MPVNLDPRAGPAWRFYSSGPAITLFPSVWRESGCESHFIIWRDEILLFGRYDDDFGEEDSPVATELCDAVLGRLPPTGELAPFSDIAEALGAIPWDVLTVCRQLVRSGVAREGTRKQRGSFGRR